MTAGSPTTNETSASIEAGVVVLRVEATKLVGLQRFALETGKRALSVMQGKSPCELTPPTTKRLPVEPAASGPPSSVAAPRFTCLDSTVEWRP